MATFNRFTEQFIAYLVMSNLPVMSFNASLIQVNQNQQWRQPTEWKRRQ
jgi:hypothetical protein